MIEAAIRDFIIPIQTMNFTLRSIFKGSVIPTDEVTKLNHILRFINKNCPIGYKFMELHTHDDFVGREPVTTYTVTYIIE